MREINALLLASASLLAVALLPLMAEGHVSLVRVKTELGTAH